MPNAAFVLLRVLTAIASLAAFTATVLLMLLEGAAGLIKGLAHGAFAVGKLFTSGFRTTGANPPADPLIVPIHAALAILFFTMFVSVFLPSHRVFLHIVAAIALAATFYRIWIMFTQHDSQVLYLPVLVLWFIYYAICLRTVWIPDPATIQ